MASAMRRFLLVCPHSHVDFRLAELTSVISMLKIGDDLKFSGTPDLETPFVSIEGSAESVIALLSRTVCVKFCIEIWGAGATWEDCHVQIKQCPHEHTSQFAAASTSFKFGFETFGRKCFPERKTELLKSMAYLDFKGKVDMKTPESVFYFVEDYGAAERQHVTKSYDIKQAYFGRLVGHGQRDTINRFNLKKRKLIGNTTMDPELSFIMSNMGHARAGSIVLDPFVGTGSLLYPCAHFGAMVMGSDLNKEVLHGVGKTSRAKTGSKKKAVDENLTATMSQYGLTDRFIGVWVLDQSRSPWRPTQLFDSIITDPPYGIREGAKKVAVLHNEAPEGTGKSSYWEHHEREQYGRNNVFDDLLNFAAQHLVVGGRLVYWLPVIKEEYTDAQVPQHPCLALIANGEQLLSGRLARRLITMEKTAEWSASVQGAQAESPVDDFRKKVFTKPATETSASTGEPTAVRRQELDGFDHHPELVPAEQWESLREWFESSTEIPWETAIEGRKVAQFGFRYDYEAQAVDPNPVAPVPPILQELPGVGQNFTQCIVNVYEANEGIPYHSDDAAFGEHIRVFCFGDERPIRFRRRVIKKEEGTRAETVELHRFSKPVGSRDCYELSGEARHLWQHSVSEGRGKRISVTFRSKA